MLATFCKTWLKKVCHGLGLHFCQWFDIVQINGIMKVEKYRQVLICHAIPSGKCLIGNDFIFQHDNNPKHTANAVKSYLERKTADKTLTVMDSTESRPEYYRGSMISPGWRKK